MPPGTSTRGTALARVEPRETGEPCYKRSPPRPQGWDASHLLSVVQALQIIVAIGHALPRVALLGHAVRPVLPETVATGDVAVLAEARRHLRHDELLATYPAWSLAHQEADGAHLARATHNTARAPSEEPAIFRRPPRGGAAGASPVPKRAARPCRTCEGFLLGERPRLSSSGLLGICAEHCIMHLPLRSALARLLPAPYPPPHEPSTVTSFGTVSHSRPISTRVVLRTVLLAAAPRTQCLCSLKPRAG